MKLNRSTLVALLFIGLVFVLACRTVDLVAQNRPTPTRTRPNPTKTVARPTRTQVVVEAESKPPTDVPQQQPPQQQQPTQPPPPTSEPATQPTNAPAPPRPTTRPTDAPPAATAPPQFLYQVQDSKCGPNVKTYIEGTIFENGSPKNDVLVRISQGPDGGPDPNDDFRTGSDPRKGYYIQNIDVNNPHEGTWYIWVIDPTSEKRISAIAIIKTDAQRVEDNGSSAGSCQSATVNFSNRGAVPAQRTATPSPTNNPNGNPSPTQDPNNDS